MAACLMHVNRVQHAVEQRLRLGTADLRLLWLLSDREPRTLREIAQDLGLEQSTVNRQVNAAVRAGRVRRSTAGDSHALVVEPTSEGLALFEEDTGFALGLFQRALDELGEGEADELVRLFERFTEAYGAAYARSAGHP